MTSVFRDRVSFSYYQTHIGADLNVCEAGYEECLPDKPCEIIPIDYFVIHYCVKGEGIFQIQDRSEHIYPGDLFMIPAHTPNKYYPVPENPWCYRWVGIRGRAAERLLADCGLSRENFFIRYRVDGELEHFFEKVYSACRMKQDFSAMGNLYCLLDHIKNHVLCQTAPALSPSELHFQELVHYIHRHYSQEISISHMAAATSIDRTYIFKLFKKYQHMSPSQYLLEYRMEKACILLSKTSLRIADISATVGFQSAPYFSRQFVKIMGVTPSAYRRQFLK